MAKDLVIIVAGRDGKNVAEVVEEIGDGLNLFGFIELNGVNDVAVVRPIY